MAQSLPVNLQYFEDQHRLIRSGHEATGFYGLDKVEKVYLDFYDSNYWQKLHQFYDTENYVMATFRYNDKIFDTVGVQFKGQTSYRKANQDGEDKLPFSVKLDQFIDGQDIEGYNNFNFNNSWGDLSMVREVLYTRLAMQHIPAAQSNFIRLYINNTDWGLYPNIQQINKDYLKEWFLTNDGIRWRAKDPDDEGGGGGGGPGGGGPKWGDGTKAMNYLGDDPIEYQKNYTLKASDVDNPWDFLITVCDILNNTQLDNLYEAVRSFLDVDAALWFLATEIVFSDDDSYVHKGEMDYQLYWDMETGLFTPLEMDGNSILGGANLRWDAFLNEDNENYPLLDRLLEVPELRQRYIAHLKTILSDVFVPDMVHEKIDEIVSIIDQQVLTDQNKFSTYNRYKSSVNQLKSSVTSRYHNLWNDSELKAESPLISQTKMVVNGYEWEQANSNDLIQIKTHVSHSLSIKQVNLHYASGYFGNFEQVEMQDEGHGNYSAILTGFNPGDGVRFYIEAVANDSPQSRQYDPVGAEHDVYFFRINMGEVVESNIVINEIMASNTAFISDESGEYDDWIELHNPSPLDQSLAGYYLSDNGSKLLKWSFPDQVMIPAGAYLIIWADGDEEQGQLHTSFKLSADGEELFLVTPEGQIADQVLFTAQTTDVAYGRLPNAEGPFQQIIPTPGTQNLYTSSVDDTSLAQSFLTVYPNPAGEYLYLSDTGWKQKNIRIMNLVGQQIDVSFEHNRLNISTLKPGIYLLDIGDGSLPIRFIKE